MKGSNDGPLEESGDGFFKAVFENARDAVFVLDLEGNFLEVNRTCLEYSGYSRAELLGMKLGDDETAGLGEKAIRGIEKLRRDGHAFFEATLWAKNGKAVDAELSASLMEYDGRPAVVCIARDITRRKRAEEALRESESLYHCLADTIRDIIGTADPKGIITYMSPSVRRILGHEPEQLIGKSAFEYIHPDDREAVVRSFIAGRKSLEPVLAVYRRRHADGHYVWLETMDNPITDENGKSLGANFVTRDVTLRKLAEDALRESETKYVDLYENAPVAFLSVGVDGIIRQCNKAAEEFAGYPREELEGMRVLDLYTKESRTKAGKLFEAFKHGIPIRGEEMAYRRKNGETVYGLLNVSAVVGEHGEVLASRSGIVDITKRKAALDALRESEEHYQALVDTSPDAVFLCDLDTRLLMVTPQTARLFGFDKPADMIGRAGVDFFTAESMPPLMEDLHVLFETGINRNREYGALRKDGSTFIAEINTTVLRDARGVPKGFVGVVRDITERKAAEEALRESEAHYQALVNTSPDAVFMSDLETRLIMVNPQAQALFGFDQETAMQGSMGIELFAPEEQPRALNNLRKLPEIGQTRMNEYRMVRKDGISFIGEISTQVVRDAAGNPQHIVGVVRDITKRKRAEAIDLALRDLALKLSSVSGLQDALAICLEEAIEHSGLDSGSIYLRNEEDGSLELSHSIGVSPSFTEKAARIDASVPGMRLIDEGVCYYGEHMQMDFPTDAVKKKEGVKAIAAIPVVHESKAIAYLFVGSHTLAEVPEDSRGFLELLAAQLGSIIARVRAEEALRESEGKYRNIFERAMEGIFQSTPEGRFLSVNPALARMHGYSSPQRMIEEVGSISDQLYFDPSERLKVMSLLMEPGFLQDFEVRMRRRDGKTFWASINVHAVKDATGNPLYLEGVMEDISARKAAKEELEASQEQLRALTGRLQQAREEERALVARELHDELGQSLTGLKIDLNWLDRRIPEQPPAGHEVWREKISGMTRLLEETIDLVRKISTELRPPLLDDFGIIPAVEWQAQEFGERTGIKCVFVSDLEEDFSLHREGNIALFRVVQESLTNVARHASATRVKIKLAIKGDDLTLEITDNGVGITDEMVSDLKSLGLLGMRERLHLLDGQIAIKGKPGKGTKIMVSIPVL